MVDREKLMWDIERCISHVPDACCDCSHADYEGFPGCMETLLKEAYDLLKAQEPHVMTLEEVRNAYNSPMWFESKGAFRGQKGFWCLHLGVSPSFHIRLMPTIGEQSTELSLTNYGTVWRCWDRRPTDEQREATPWR